jgi:hypothetical protein
VRLEIFDELRVVDARRAERRAALAALTLFELAVNRRFAHGDFGDLAIPHHRLEVTVGNLAPTRREQVGLPECEDEQRAQHPPDGGGAR